MKKLQDEFDKLMTETEAEAERVKDDDFDKIKKIAATCNIVIEQINKLTTNLDTLKEKGENEHLFVSMKRAESQLKSLEGNLEKTDKENVVRDYKFEPNAKLITLLKDLKELGQLLFEKPGNAGTPQQIKTISASMQSIRPTYIKDITVSSPTSNVLGSLVLPNKQIIVTDYLSMQLKLIDTNQDKTISKIQVSGRPLDTTMVKDNEVAVTLATSQNSKIQFVSVSKKSLSKGREISVNGYCKGIAYYTRDQTLIIATGNDPGKIQIIDMSGSVIKCLDKDSKGDHLFASPQCVALSPDMTELFVTDSIKCTVTVMTMNGNVKAVYQDASLQGPRGLCVTKLGVVYVVGNGSHTVHQLDPVSGTLKLLLDEKDGLDNIYSISYSDKEDKMYIGMEDGGILKVFQMK